MLEINAHTVQTSAEFISDIGRDDSCISNGQQAAFGWASVAKARQVVALQCRLAAAITIDNKRAEERIFCGQRMVNASCVLIQNSFTRCCSLEESTSSIIRYRH